MKPTSAIPSHCQHCGRPLTQAYVRQGFDPSGGDKLYSEWLVCPTRRNPTDAPGFWSGPDLRHTSRQVRFVAAAEVPDVEATMAGWKAERGSALARFNKAITIPTSWARTMTRWLLALLVVLLLVVAADTAGLICMTCS